MQIQELVNRNLKKEYKISVPFSKVDGDITTLIEEKGKAYKAPGFRPGKVPLSQLKKVFYAEAFQTVIEKTVQEASKAFFQEHAFKTALRPEYVVDAFPMDGKDLEFRLIFEVLPELPEISWKDLTLTTYEVEVPKEMLEENLKKLAESERNSRPLSVQRPAQKGDTVLVDLELRDKLKSEPGKFENTSVYLNETGTLSDIEEGLLGATAGVVVEKKLQLPMQLSDPKLAGSSYYMKMLVKEVRETVPFEVGEELAKHLGFENLEALQNKEKESLEAYAKNLSFLQLKRQILDYFAEKYTFDIPENMQKLEFKSIWQDALRELNLEPIPGKEEAEPHEHLHEDPHDHTNCAVNQNVVSPEVQAVRDKIFEENSGKKEEELRETYQKVSERRVRLGLLFGKIGEIHKIALSEEDRTHLLKAELKKYPGREQEVFNFYKKNPQALVALQAPLFEQRVVEFIAAQAAKVEQKIALKEIESLLENNLF